MVEWTAIYFLIFHVLEKNNFEFQRNFNANTRLVALFEIFVGICLLTSKKEDNAVKLRQ